MPPLTDKEKAQVRTHILAELATTPYACSGLTELTNGTTNFVFRGVLERPLADGPTSVVVKHATGFAAVNKDFALDISRSIFEESMLQVLNHFPPVASSPWQVKVPRLYLAKREAHVQVLEDVADARDLKDALLVSSVREEYRLHDKDTAKTLGHALGTWLKAFHTWADPSVLDIGTNEPMRQLKHKITYDALVRTVSNFPDVLGDHLPVLEAVQAMATEEFSRQPTQNDSQDWGFLHGDFWSGNILLAHSANCSHAVNSHATVAVVDWEFAQFGHRAYDVGQMLGDLLERAHFGRVDRALDVMAGFVEGYGFMDEDGDNFAFRVAIHAGVQLLGFYIRRAPDGPLPGDAEQVRAAVLLGTDLVVCGWQQDRKGLALLGLSTK